MSASSLDSLDSFDTSYVSFSQNAWIIKDIVIRLEEAIYTSSTSSQTSCSLGSSGPFKGFIVTEYPKVIRAKYY